MGTDGDTLVSKGGSRRGMITGGRYTERGAQHPTHQHCPPAPGLWGGSFRVCDLLPCKGEIRDLCMRGRGGVGVGSWGWEVEGTSPKPPQETWRAPSTPGTGPFSEGLWCVGPAGTPREGPQGGLMGSSEPVGLVPGMYRTCFNCLQLVVPGRSPDAFPTLNWF